MPSSLDLTAGQILDKLADIVNGPVQGTATAVGTGASEKVIPQGQLGTLTGGRIVRVTKSTRLFGTTAKAVPVRLLYLAPAYPKAGNFEATALSTVVTWISPPANVAATATTSVFAANAKGSGLKIVSLVEKADGETGNDVLSSGAQGDNLILLAPRVRPLGGGGSTSSENQFFEVLWRLRYQTTALGPESDRRTRARLVYDALTDVLQGATAGDDVVKFGEWMLAKTAGGADIEKWDLTFYTRLWSTGRVYETASQGAAFETLGETIKIGGDGLQTPSHQVKQDIDVNP